MQSGQTSPFGRRVAVFAIKFVHTALFGVISTSVLYVFACGTLGWRTRWTVPAAGIVLVEMAVFAGNGWRCPLTALAEDMGAERGRVTDIFLPLWFADRIPQIYTPLFAIGVAGLLWRGRRRAITGRA